VLRSYGRTQVKIWAVAEAEKPTTMAPANADAIKEEIMTKLRYQFGKIEGFEMKDIYRGAAWSAREHLIDSFEKTQEYWE
jgi:starch phosphorylase